VHASLSSFGNIEGGALAVCSTLLEAVGDSGTVMMPAFTCAETWPRPDPDKPLSRPVAFHADISVSKEVGTIAEAFRRLPGVLRSSHPTHSFAAWGRHAREVLSTQRDNNPFGPLKKLNIMQCCCWGPPCSRPLSFMWRKSASVSRISTAAPRFA
jgi:aminoglycoside 3-N-acetyltransferase